MNQRSKAAWLAGRSALMVLAGVTGGGLLSACDEKPRPPPPPPAVSSGTDSHARRVVEDRISANLRVPATAKFRGVQVYQQADPRVVAVCGQVNPAAREDQAFLPFVAVVTYARRPEAGTPAFDIEPYVASTNAEATRVYIEMTSRCGENGGPRLIGNRRVIPPLPPLPSDLPDQLQVAPAAAAGRAPAGQFVLTPVPVAGLPAEPAPPPPPVQSAAPSADNVTMRQAGNIRVGPVGGSQLVRVAPKGAVLRVFSQAPGGWLQVGESEPEGWVHSSLVESQ